MDEKKEMQIFNDLFINYKGRFTPFAGMYVNADMIAEYIAAESLMYYWENRKTLDNHSNVLAYILRVVKQGR